MPARSGGSCEDTGVNVIFMAPTAMRGIKREDPTGALVGDYDLSQLRTLFLAGERCDPERWSGR